MERQAVAKFLKIPTGNDNLHRQSARSSSMRNSLLELQRSVGNHAIQRLTSSPLIQAKLQISAPEDESELEADRVADTVMRMPEPAVSRQAVVQPVQRACAECEDEKQSGEMVHRQAGAQTVTPNVTPSMAANIQAMNGGGSPLSDTTRAFFEPRFGADLSQVRVHTDSRAAATAKSIQARAFTVGSNIAFGAGHYAPESHQGRQLLAHELTHVFQQNRERVQRDTEHKITKQYDPRMPRAEVQRVLREYFEKMMKAQGGRSVSMTEDVKTTLRRIVSNDMQATMTLDSYLGLSTLPGSPAELAEAVAAHLPDPLNASSLAHLGASSGRGRTTMQRVGDLVKKTEPFESPDTLEQKWRFDREATQLRKGEGAFGPFGVDLNRIFNIGKGLRGALKPPPSRGKVAEARSYQQVNDVIDTISKTALVPAEARGTSNAGSFADAQEVARYLARQLDIAYQQKNDTVTLRLDPNYYVVKDRVEMIHEVIKLVHLIREALPHQASGVSKVDVYFGAKLMQRILLGQKAE